MFAVILACFSLSVLATRADAENLCPCPRSLIPVCGSDGKTYDNDCLARCAGQTVNCKGQCPCAAVKREAPKVCPCPYNFDLVCGSDGKTYSNECGANCDGQTVSCKGQCPCPIAKRSAVREAQKLCACPFIDKPVCGSDGIKYSNDCIAKCAGVVYTDYKEGAC